MLVGLLHMKGPIEELVIGDVTRCINIDKVLGWRRHET